MSLCEACGQHNNYKSLDEMFEHVCLHCVDAGEARECEYSGEWHVVETCACGKTGAANYFGWRLPSYYCGGSSHCTP